MATRTDRYNEVWRNGGNGARKSVVALGGQAVGAPPYFLPVGQREATKGVGALFLIIIEQIDASVKYGRGGMAFAEADRPENLGARRRPAISKFYIGF